ncbi:MAG: GNAT family N-acetyltransferase [Candidatus Helarchaeota archaeon]|nr:GNAT family N-acetyltransferase [Candidatus Helarchaeota archaeon]
MNDILIIRQPKTRKEFESMYDLRWRILSKPWDQPKNSEKDDLESIAHHFIALFQNKVVGTARFHKLNESFGQIQYLAVEESFQRKGIGGKLLEAIHLTAMNQLLKFTILNANETAWQFFEKMGYKTIEDGPLLFGEVRQKKMIRKFNRNDLKLQKIMINLRKSLSSQ